MSKSYFNDLFTYAENWVIDNYWILLEITLIILGCYFSNKIFSHFLYRLKIISKRTKAFWDDALLISIEKPIKLAIWLIGFTFIFDAVNHEIKINLLKFAPLIRNISVITIISWIAISFTSAFENNCIKGTKKTRFDRFTADITAKIFKVTVITIAGLAILESFGFNISGIIALGGIGGAALAFASQSLLSNFFGTAIIYLDKPFAIGENILIKGENLRGTVEEIGWRITMIRTTEQVPVYVQNSVFSKDSIINYSRVTHRKISEKMGITTLDINQVEIITRDIKNFLELHADIDNEFKIIVALTDFGQDFVELLVEAVVKLRDTKDFPNIRQEVMIGVFNVLKKHQCQVVFSNDNKALLARI
ncbi:mechanosensitive ion channel [Holosporaceae bacterium 'Namur']|nr:mechanosensitive ion channel [Holosporaceae bacterium 'Namur']